MLRGQQQCSEAASYLLLAKLKVRSIPLLFACT